LCRLGRFAEAEEWSRRGEEFSPVDDVATQVQWRGARGRALAARDELAEAKKVALEAVRLGERTDALNRRAGAMLDYAEVLLRSGSPGEAGEVVAQAVELYERKGNVVAAKQARDLLAVS
jgi:thioredoxin-like negative regulator of GroEL